MDMRDCSWELLQQGLKVLKWGTPACKSYKHGGQFEYWTDRVGKSSRSCCLRGSGARSHKVLGSKCGSPAASIGVTWGLARSELSGLCPGPTESETLGVLGSSDLCLNKPPRWIRCCCSENCARPLGHLGDSDFYSGGEKILEVWGQRSDVIWTQKKRKPHLYPGPILRDSNLISQRYGLGSELSETFQVILMCSQECSPSGFQVKNRLQGIKGRSEKLSWEATDAIWVS